MNGDDVEFRKSRHSGMEDGCVEIGRDGDLVRIRDSKTRDAGMLSFTAEEVRWLFARLRDR